MLVVRGEFVLSIFRNLTFLITYSISHIFAPKLGYYTIDILIKL